MVQVNEVKEKPLGIILMTALVPTIGHKYLIDFSSAFMQGIGGDLHVFVCYRDFEPTRGTARTAALMYDVLNTPLQFHNSLFGGSGKIYFHPFGDDDAPQNPTGDDDVEFWNYWKGIVEQRTTRKVTHVFASEPYGIKLSEVFDATFIPCDIDREIFPIKGSDVRSDIRNNFDKVIPAFRQHLCPRITLFGQESVGKTTMAKALANHYSGTYLPEWARGYLETVGAELTDEKMENIFNAQHASQLAVQLNPPKHMTFLDTDLLSTIGYYRIYNGLEITPTSHPRLAKKFMETKSDLYVVMNDDIPFTPDQLRYGGDKRESTKEFWINLLEEYGCHYYVVKETDHAKQLVELIAKIDPFAERYGLVNFERE